MPRQAFLQSSPLPTGEAGRAYHAHAVIPCYRRGPRLKRMRSCQQLITNAGQRIQVVARIRATTLQLLAACISGRPIIGSVVGMLRLRRDRREAGTEVQDAELTLAGDEDVSRLKVAMNNPALVSVCQSCAKLLDQLPSLRFAHRRRTEAFNYVAQRLAVEQFHRGKDHVPIAVQFVNIHYVSMG